MPDLIFFMFRNFEIGQILHLSCLKLGFVKFLKLVYLD